MIFLVIFLIACILFSGYVVLAVFLDRPLTPTDQALAATDQALDAPRQARLPGPQKVSASA